MLGHKKDAASAWFSLCLPGPLCLSPVCFLVLLSFSASACMCASPCLSVSLFLPTLDTHFWKTQPPCGEEARPPGEATWRFFQLRSQPMQSHRESHYLYTEAIQIYLCSPVDVAVRDFGLGHTSESPSFFKKPMCVSPILHAPWEAEPQ